MGGGRENNGHALRGAPTSVDLGEKEGRKEEGEEPDKQNIHHKGE